MNYIQINSLIDKINRNGFNRLNLALDKSERREILKRSKFHWKRNLEFLDSDIDKPLLDLELMTKEGLKMFRVRPDRRKDWGFFIKIELIKVFHCDRIQAEKIIELNGLMK